MENSRGTRTKAQSRVHGAYQTRLGKELYSRNPSWGGRPTTAFPVVRAEGRDVDTLNNLGWANGPHPSSRQPLVPNVVLRKGTRDLF